MTTRRSRRRWFFLGMARASALIVFVGFAPTYYLRGLDAARALPPGVDLHSVLFTRWVMLFLAQSLLVSAKRTALHLQVGVLHTASELNDFIARATQKRWSPVVQLEHLVEAELAARFTATGRTAPEGRAPRPLQDDGRFRMGLVDAPASADRRTRPRPDFSPSAKT